MDHLANDDDPAPLVAALRLLVTEYGGWLAGQRESVGGLAKAWHPIAYAALDAADTIVGAVGIHSVISRQAQRSPSRRSARTATLWPPAKSGWCPNSRSRWASASSAGRGHSDHPDGRKIAAAPFRAVTVSRAWNSQASNFGLSSGSWALTRLTPDHPAVMVVADQTP